MAPSYEDDLKATTKKYKGMAGYGAAGADLAARDSLKNRWTLDDNENFVRKGANRDFVRNAPVQQAHDSIDSGEGGLLGGPMNVPGQEPRTNAEGDYVYDDNIDDMFAGVGGLGEGRSRGQEKEDEEPQEASSRPKMSAGARVGSFFKGVGNALTYPLWALGGLIGAAAFRRQRHTRGRALKAEAAKPMNEQGQFFTKVRSQEKAKNRLGTARRLYTGRTVADYFKEAFTGRSMGFADSRKYYFSGGAFGTDPSKKSRDSLLDSPADNTALPEEPRRSPMPVAFGRSWP